MIRFGVIFNTRGYPDTTVMKVEFDEELYKRNLEENSFEIEYEGGEDNADN